MKYLKFFENVKNEKNKEELIEMISKTSEDFWRMVDIANWDKAIEKYNYFGYNEKIIRTVEYRIYNEFTFEQIIEFKKEYDNLYEKVYNYFDPFYDDINMGGGDDSWGDFLSSIIGKNKKYLLKSIDNPSILKNMIYMENFRYILNPSFSEYNDIKYDGNITKFNL